MRLKAYLTSDQFLWSLYQSALAYLLVAIPAMGAYLSDEVSWNTTRYVLFMALLPVVKRLQEGISDAMRDQAGATLPRDVKAKRRS